MIIGILLMLLTMIVLVIGLFLMAKGGKLNKKYSGKLMAARVAFQFLAIIALFILFASSGNS